MVLRCHLGIYVPEIPEGFINTAPKELETDEENSKQNYICYLQVGKKRQTWYNGKCLVFDDTYIHAAVNDSKEERVILLLDFNTGIKLTEEEKSLISDPNEQKSDGEQSAPVPDQRKYLDDITTSYGY